MPRFSFHVGPGVWVHIGGRRRRAQPGTGCWLAGSVMVALAVTALLLLLALIGHLIGLTPSPAELNNRSAWLSAHYPDIVWRFVLAAVLVIGVMFLIAGVFASPRSRVQITPVAPDSAPARGDGRRWVPIIRSTCPDCGHVDERPGGVYLCPKCGTRNLSDKDHEETGRGVLER